MKTSARLVVLLFVQRTQNAATANQISAVVAPRVVRLGVKVTW